MEMRSAEALLARARRRAAGGDAVGARADLDHAVRHEPSSPRVRLARAEWLISTGDLVAARADVEHAVELGAGTGALAVRGWLALHLHGDPEAAERDLSEAIDAGDRRPASYITRGWARYVRGDHSGALADAIRGASRDPLDADARFLVAVSRVQFGDRGGVRDLDRAEALYAAAGDHQGRREVWQLREAIRQGRTPLPTPSDPWLFLGPQDRRDEREHDGFHDQEGAGKRRSRWVVRVRGGRLTLVAIMEVVRYVVTVAAVALLTFLPGVSAGPPNAVTVLVAGLSYRVLHAGASSLLAPLLVLVPVSALRWMHAGPLPLVTLVRWSGAAALAALVFAVAAWVTGWLGLDFRVGGLATVLAAGMLFGLGTFMAFPILRRES